MFDELSSEDEKKKWLFKENVRLQELSRNLEDERKLIEIQMGMLQRQQSKNMLLKKQLEDMRAGAKAAGQKTSGHDRWRRHPGKSGG